MVYTYCCGEVDLRFFSDGDIAFIPPVGVLTVTKLAWALNESSPPSMSCCARNSCGCNGRDDCSDVIPLPFVLEMPGSAGLMAEAVFQPNCAGNGSGANTGVDVN